MTLSFCHFLFSSVAPEVADEGGAFFDSISDSHDARPITQATAFQQSRIPCFLPTSSGGEREAAGGPDHGQPGGPPRLDGRPAGHPRAGVRGGDQVQPGGGHIPAVGQIRGGRGQGRVRQGVFPFLASEGVRVAVVRDHLRLGNLHAKMISEDFEVRLVC